MKIYLAGAEKQWSSWTNAWKELTTMKIYLAGTGSPINNYLLSEDDMKLFLANQGGGFRTCYDDNMKLYLAESGGNGRPI